MEGQTEVMEKEEEKVVCVQETKYTGDPARVSAAGCEMFGGEGVGRWCG